MRSLDPFSFNAIRFALGALFVWLVARPKAISGQPFPWKLGIVLFIAASLQQIGIIYTSAGAAGFITGLYVVIVPLLGIFKAQKLRRHDIAAIVLAVLGMLLINRPADMQASLGNVLVLFGALFWAVHLQLVDRYAARYETGRLAFSQFAVCAVLSAAFTPVYLLLSGKGAVMPWYLANGASQALWALLYGGLLSVGIAYTLQVKAQKKVAPAKAAVILCLEGVFANLGGYVILGESLNMAVLGGMALMFAATLLAVLPELFC